MPRIIITAALLVLAIALPAAAADVTHSSSDIAGTVLNPCNGEVVEYTGSCQLIRSTNYKDDGSSRGAAKLLCHADGYGSYGNHYTVNQSFFTKSTTPACPSNDGTATDFMSDRLHFVSQGSDGNFWLRVDIYLSYEWCEPGPTEFVVDDEVECRG